MTYRNANYTAFYVDESYSNGNLQTHFAKDFCYYQVLKLWKNIYESFPFIDAHNKTYNVRDTSDWESTLKPRIHERLCMSKNIILILSSITKESKALKEEIIYGIDKLGLPIIVAYPELSYVGFQNDFNNEAKNLWDKLPSFKSRIYNVPTAHIPFKKEYFKKALTDPRFSVTTKRDAYTIGLNSKADYDLHLFAQRHFRR